LEPDDVVCGDALMRLLNNACGRAGLDRVYWDRQALPTSELALLPPGIDEPRSIAALVGAVRAVLDEVNDEAGPRLRIRVVFHQGITRLVDERFTGRAVTTIGQLIQSPSIGAAWVRCPSADLVVIVSDELFPDLADHRIGRLDADDFDRVAADETAGSEPRGWIYVSARASAAGS
jgi:hypothetical protein